MHASFPEATIIPLSKFSTVTSSPTIINIDEYPAVESLQAFSEIINLSSILKSPDFIKSKEGYEKAVASALGEKLKWILINDKNNTIDTIQTFKNTCSGRGTFISLDNRRLAGGSLRLNQISIMDCIECSQENRPFLSSILGDTYVSDGLVEAIKAREEFPGFNFVTKDGEFFDANGSISVGSAPENILQIKDEIKDLNNQKHQPLSKDTLIRL